MKYTSSPSHYLIGFLIRCGLLRFGWEFHKLFYRCIHYFEKYQKLLSTTHCHILSFNFSPHQMLYLYSNVLNHSGVSSSKHRYLDLLREQRFLLQYISATWNLKVERVILVWCFYSSSQVHHLLFQNYMV